MKSNHRRRNCRSAIQAMDFHTTHSVVTIVTANACVHVTAYVAVRRSLSTTYTAVVLGLLLRQYVSYQFGVWAGPLELKSNALTTRPSWYGAKAAQMFNSTKHTLKTVCEHMYMTRGLRLTVLDDSYLKTYQILPISYTCMLHKFCNRPIGFC